MFVGGRGYHAGPGQAGFIHPLMSNDAVIIRQVRALGIPDPTRATVETLRIVLQAYFTRRVLNEDTFRGYMGMLNPSLQILMEGLKAFSLDQSGLSHKVLNHIEVAMGVLKTRLDRPDITPQEAREIRGAILDLVREAREEANEQRIVTVGLAAFATTALVAVAGGIMAALADRRSLPGGGSATTVRVPLLKNKG